MPHQGATVWFTGIPSSGKSEIAREVERRLIERGIRAERLDGPEIRQSLSRGLGFSPADREEHVRRIGFVAKLLSRNGVIAICVAVSPYRATRDEVRRKTTNFIEVFVDCPVDVAEQRDRERLYARARLGDIEEFTAVTAPYEPPLDPEIHIHSDRESVQEAAARVLAALESLEIIPRDEAAGIPRSEEDEIRQRLSRLGDI